MKEALDHAKRWRDDTRNENWADQALRGHGLRWSDFRYGSNAIGPHHPDAFTRILLGSWFGHDEGGENIGISTLPGWAVIGWLFKHRYTAQLSADELESAAERLNKEALTDPPTAYGFHGIPLYWSFEGKNRTQLHRLAGVDRTSILTLYKTPNLDSIWASPVAGLPWAIALHYKSGEQEILPFGNLARELLTAFGVSWTNFPSVSALRYLPRQIERAGNDDPPTLKQVFRWLLSDHKALRLALIGGKNLAEPTAPIVHPSSTHSQL